MNHALFISSAYGISVLVIAALLAWILIDQRLRRRELAELERRGIRRRSSGPAE